MDAPQNSLSQRRTVALAVAALLGLFAGAAQADLVQYDWVQGAGPGGTGSMIFDLGSGTNGANFSIPKASLIGFTFQFTGGGTVNLASLNSINVATNMWTASSGYLTTVAQLSKTGASPLFTFQYQPYLIASPNPNGSTAVETSPVILQNFGYWKLDPATPPSPVPLPAAFWLMGAGLTGLVGAARKKAKNAAQDDGKSVAAA